MVQRRKNGSAADGAADPPSPELLALRYRRLELALIDAATATLAGTSLPEGAPLVSAETAIKLLTLRGAGAAKLDAEAQTIDPAALRQTLSARIAAVRHAVAVPSEPHSDKGAT